MSSVLTGILINAATKVGAPLIVDALSSRLGAGTGKLAGTIIDAVAGNAGITPEQIPSCPESTLGEAISAVESNMPSIILASVKQQEETNRLMLTEMDKGATWTWAWRPAFMWAILSFWVWSLLVAPTLSIFIGHAINFPLADHMLTISLAYLGLYMGGHTAKQFAKGGNHERNL